MSFKTYLDWSPSEFDKHRDILGPRKKELKTIPDWIKEEIYAYDMEYDLNDHGSWKVVDILNYHGRPGQRLVLHNGKVYTYIKETVHDVILVWMILNAGINISEFMFDNWYTKPSTTNFLCLHQINDTDIYYSESYDLNDDLAMHTDKFQDMLKKLESVGYNIVLEVEETDYNYS